jgi:predicted lipoprotein with Yx(FWY)xxD motif
MSRRISITCLVCAAVVPLAFVAGCGGGGSSSTALPTTMDGRPATLGVATTGLGSILVDSQGRTLYLFKKDSGTESSCTGSCAGYWPPLRANGSPTVGSGADASLLGTTSRSDGNPQVTYNGHPLYLYRGDQKLGDVTGQGLTAFGGGWFALSPTGAQVSGQTTSSGGSYGY